MTSRTASSATLAAILAGAVGIGSCTRGPESATADPTPVPTSAPAAPPAPTGPDRAAVVAAAKALVARTPFATLTTIDMDGAPVARIVEPFPIEGDFVAWIATNSATRKVREIERDARVTLLYFDQTALGYVTLIGTAAIVRDPAEKAKRWKDSWVGFYKDRNRGDDYTLIRVTPARLEISSPSQGMNNDPATWRPVTIAIGRN